MHIAVYGPGAIGSTFAFQLARTGHEVTVVARGARLAQIAQDGAIVTSSGERASVRAAETLDPSVAFDAVLVTVLAPQVDAILPALRASRARRIVFMFNTFRSIAPLRDAVGPERFAFGFPGGVFVLLEGGRIAPQIRSGTTATDAALAKLFTEAGIPTVVDDDMQSWLRTHAAMVYPLMGIGVLVHARGAGISWREAVSYADAFIAGMRIVRAMGNDLRPTPIGALARLPRAAQAGLLWLLSRTKMLRELGQLGPAEPRMLADMMTEARPDLAAPLAPVRP